MSVPESRAHSLTELARLIEEEHSLGEEQGRDHFRRAGEYLLEVQSQLPRGKFASWVQKHCSFEPRTANKYMRLAKDYRQNSRELRERLAAGKSPLRPNANSAAWYQKVRASFRPENFGRRTAEQIRAADMGKVRETKLARDLAHKLIDVGYKVFAGKFHPDHQGGSHEAMQRLNKVRTALHAAADRLEIFQ